MFWALNQPHVASWKFNTHANLTGERKPSALSVVRRQYPLASELLRTVQIARALFIDAAKIKASCHIHVSLIESSVSADKDLVAEHIDELSVGSPDDAV